MSAISPLDLAVIAAKCRSISASMSSVLLRSARSGIINSGRDFSSALLTGDGAPLIIDEGVPVHVGGAQLAVRAILDLFDDVEPGDCYLNNSPFHGNTHHADLTLCSPVFVDDELLFWVMSRAHHADIGAPLPTTYLPHAATVQEEGLHLPCMRIWRHGVQVDDVIRLLLGRVRVPSQSEGDYLAQVGAVRAGERRLIDLAEDYGAERLKAFCSEWIAYGERMMSAHIRALPGGRWQAASRHDPLPNAPDGVLVRASLQIDPEAGLITVDLRDNDDSLANGFNLTEATTLAAANAAVMNNVARDIPRNAGSLSRIRVLMREGAAVGIPREGVGTSLATTNLCDRVFNAVHGAFAQIGPGYGLAEASCGATPSLGVAAGTDPRFGGAPFINQMVVGCSGGPALQGHDGWLTYNKPVSGGLLRVDSIELNELRFPLLYEAVEIVEDSSGAGEWIGAPSLRTVFGPRLAPLSVAYYGDCFVNPPRGVRGGKPGGRAAASLRRAGKVSPLPAIGMQILEPDDRIESVWAAGGGYGDPRRRDPRRVVSDVTAGITSARRAREDFGVALEPDPEDGCARLDVAGTAALRNQGPRSSEPRDA